MLLEALQNFCTQHDVTPQSGRTCWVAYSGGLDSQVLLALCYELRQRFPIKLRAIHVNHGLSVNASAWSAHCARVCRDYAIDYVEERIHLELQQGVSLEELAREKRYAVFATHLADGDVLLTAHQQDDQAETVLLQLLRGAGLKGLAAMPVMKPFARGFHARPLLNFSRSVLKQYAKQQQLKWIDDESNVNQQFARNFLRHEILPVLEKRWPSVAATLSRSAAHCAEAQELIEEFASDLCEQVQGSIAHTLSVAKLLQLDAARQNLVLRMWIHQHGLPLPSAKKLATIQSNVLTAAWDRMPCVKWQGAELRRYRDDVYVMPALSQPDAQQCLTWDFTEVLTLTGIGSMQALSVQGKGLRADLKPVLVRLRQGGEVMHIAHRGHVALKNLFQEWGVPPWKRSRIPLIFLADKLVCAVGYFIDKDYMAGSREMGYEFELEKTINNQSVII